MHDFVLFYDTYFNKYINSVLKIGHHIWTAANGFLAWLVDFKEVYTLHTQNLDDRNEDFE